MGGLKAELEKIENRTSVLENYELEKNREVEEKADSDLDYQLDLLQQKLNSTDEYNDDSLIGIDTTDVATVVTDTTDVATEAAMKPDSFQKINTRIDMVERSVVSLINTTETSIMLSFNLTLEDQVKKLQQKTAYDVQQMDSRFRRVIDDMKKDYIMEDTRQQEYDKKIADTVKKLDKKVASIIKETKKALTVIIKKQQTLKEINEKVDVLKNENNHKFETIFN